MSRISGLWWHATTLMGRLKLASNGVSQGRNLRLLGLPIVTRAPGSTIAIAGNCVMVSTSRGTALGVRGPVIIRTLNARASITIGPDTGMSGTVICAAKSVTIGARCLIGSDCMIFDTDFHNHELTGADGLARRYSTPDWERISAPVVIGNDVFLGARTIVCKGVTIGSGTIVAAGSIVTADLPENVIAAGSPARVVRHLDTARVRG